MTTWVIKLHSDDPCVQPEYLHNWETGLYDKWVDKPEWVLDQKYAYRFTDRNYVSRVAYSAAVQNYHDNPQIVRLKPRSSEDKSEESKP